MMAGKVETRLKELGIVLPTPSSPAANYVPTVRSGALFFVSGQISLGADGSPIRGRLGEALSIEQGQSAARQCAISILAQVKAALGDLDQVRRLVKLGGWVNCTPDFTDQPKVMNGASDLMVEVFGDAGRHARFAVGAPSLPLGVAVEVEATLEIA